MSQNLLDRASHSPLHSSTPWTPLTPDLPPRYHADFVLYYTPREDVPLPPWLNNVPSTLPYSVGRGQVWYADDLGITVEQYTDFCLAIFEPNSYFPCTIFNYNRTAYFISPAYTGYGPCCVYRTNWSHPHRDFMRQFAAQYNRTTVGFGSGILQQSIDWWEIPNTAGYGQRSRRVIEHPIFGGYGWASEPLPSGYRPQVCFWFEGNVGWTQQLFYNFVDSGSNTRALDSFELPEECRTALACLYEP